MLQYIRTFFPRENRQEKETSLRLLPLGPSNSSPLRTKGIGLCVVVLKFIRDNGLELEVHERNMMDAS